MNRIERLIWEQTQMNAIRLHGKSLGAKVVKFISLTLLAGVFVLFASRLWTQPLDDSVVHALLPVSIVYVPVVAPTPTYDVGSSAATPSRDMADAAAKAAPRGRPPIPTF